MLDSGLDAFVSASIRVAFVRSTKESKHGFIRVKCPVQCTAAGGGHVPGHREPMKARKTLWRNGLGVKSCAATGPSGVSRVFLCIRCVNFRVAGPAFRDASEAALAAEARAQRQRRLRVGSVSGPAHGCDWRVESMSEHIRWARCGAPCLPASAVCACVKPLVY